MELCGAHVAGLLATPFVRHAERGTKGAGHHRVRTVVAFMRVSDDSAAWADQAQLLQLAYRYTTPHVLNLRDVAAGRPLSTGFTPVWANSTSSSPASWQLMLLAHKRQFRFQCKHAPGTSQPLPLQSFGRPRARHLLRHAQRLRARCYPPASDWVC